MRSYLLLLLLSNLLLLFLCSFNNPICKGARYYCGSDNSPHICINVSDTRQRVHYLQSCPAETYCPFTSNYTNNTIRCIPKPAGNLTLPGEYCSNNQECLSTNCENGICKGKLLEEKCTDHSDCDPGLFCNGTTYPDSRIQKICLKQVAFGENCTNSYECTNNCACTLGKCAYYYSLDNNIASNNTETCASGYIVNDTCTESRKSQFAGSPCSSDTDCALVNSSGYVVGYSECSCGINGGAFSYCSLTEGDPEFLNIMNTFQYILLRSFHCHTFLRFGPCKYIYNDEYTDFQRAIKKYQMYPQLVFNDPCIKNIYTIDYWKLFGDKLTMTVIWTICCGLGLFLL